MIKKVEDIKRAIALRKKGHTYNEIVKELHCAKSSVSYWVRDVYIPNDLRIKIANNRLDKLKSYRGKSTRRISVTKTKLQRLLRKRNYIKDIAKLLNCSQGKVISDIQYYGLEKEYDVAALRKKEGLLRRRPSFNLKVNLTDKEQKLKIAFLMLYYGEGGKTNNFDFSNSDPKMIQIALKALRTLYNIDENRIKCSLQLLDIHVVSERFKYWRQITGVSNFAKPIITKHNPKKFKSHYGGTLKIRICDTSLLECVLADIKKITTYFLA